jgi:hypothetical protein
VVRKSIDENTIGHYQWVKRIVAAQPFPENIAFSLPNMNGRHRFDKFEFEIREKALWMSFKNLSWVMLRNLGGGYFFDDRSIQRQFAFNYTHGKYSLLVSREWENVISIKESEF